LHFTVIELEPSQLLTPPGVQDPVSDLKSRAVKPSASISPSGSLQAWQFPSQELAGCLSTLTPSFWKLPVAPLQKKALACPQDSEHPTVAAENRLAVVSPLICAPSAVTQGWHFFVQLGAT